jgi:flagellar protein FliS
MALARSTERNFNNGLPFASELAPGHNTAARPNAVNHGAMRQYQRAQVETASPTRLVVLLYDGAIRFCHKGQEAMRRGEFETQNTNLINAQRIVGELLGSLNREAGGEVAANLTRVYTYLLEELVKANLYDKPEILDHAIWVLDELRASWVEIDRMAAGNAPGLPAMALVGPGVQEPSAARPGPASTADGPGGRLLSKTARLINSQRTAERHGSEPRLGDRLV